MITMSIKEKLEKKTVAQINAIGTRLGLPLRGSKRERINTIDSHFKFIAGWKVISNTK
jgi:hypothetical protein